MNEMNIDQVIALIASLLSIASFCGNIIQYKNRNSLIQRLRSFAQGTYMDHYMIARACSRVRYPRQHLNTEFCCQQVNYIAGISDAARNSIIAVAEEHLGMTPKFRHPAFPEKSEFEDEIKLGMAPDLRMSEISRTVENRGEGMPESTEAIEKPALSATAPSEKPPA
jgi:hypothetical protein